VRYPDSAEHVNANDPGTDTFNASIPMTLADGTKLIKALGIGRMRWYRTEHKTIVAE